jgi:DNA repair protein RecN (Recombination protein N)
MLEQLHIENLAIIEHLSIQFHPGFNVITGETGTGKSIIVNAIKLLMGERATREIVRHGKENAIIEAIFTGKQEIWEKTLLKVGIEPAEELLVKRIINKEGKNKVFINGQLATLQILQQLTSPLLTLSGQHEYQRLLLPFYQLEILDAFAELGEKKRKWQQLYHQFFKKLREKEELTQKLKQQTERKKLLLFEIQEIENAHLSGNEENELKEEKNACVI